MSVIHALADWSGGEVSGPLRRMINASSYWRPEDEDVVEVLDHSVALARLALFNTRPSRHERVFQSDCGRYAACAHARLDNRDFLLDALGLHGGDRDHRADGELILAAYRHWGERCPERLLGDFAFVVWDRDRRSFFCARDPLGVKALYYAVQGTRVLVSNEHRALAESGWVDNTLDERWLLERCLALGGSEMGSPFAAVRSVPAAHYVTLSENGAEERRYWSLKQRDFPELRTEEDYLAELDRRFRVAVARRLNSDFPLGAELSEGLDSVGITAVAAEIAKPALVHTLSYQCVEEDETNREVWGATYRDIREHLALHDNLRPVWTTNPPEEPDGVLNRAFGAPFPGFGGNLLRARRAGERGVRTLLSGWGGDHCVTSYGDDYVDELLLRGRLVAAHRLIRGMHARGRGASPPRAWARLVVKHALPPLHRRRLLRGGSLTGHMYHRLQRTPLRREALDRWGLREDALAFITRYDRASVRERDERELFDIGVERRLVESELSARIARTEFRFPMLDVELLDLAYNVPSALKTKDGVERHMFREILKGRTTERIRMRRKVDVDLPARDRRAEVGARLEATLEDLRRCYYPGLDRYLMRERVLGHGDHLPPGMRPRELGFVRDVSRALWDGVLRLPDGAAER